MGKCELACKIRMVKSVQQAGQPPTSIPTQAKASQPNQARLAQYSVKKTAAIADLSYLTYFPFPLSTS